MSPRPPRSHSGRILTPVAIALAILSVGALAFRSGAYFKSNAPTAAPIVAVVDIEVVVNDCEELKARNKAIEARFKNDFDQLRAWDEEMTKKSNEMKTLPATDIAAKRVIRRAGAELQGKSQALSEFLQATLDEERADVLRDIYNKTVAGIAQYAAQNNIALVIADDSVLKVPETGPMKDVNMSIVQRRLLFVNKAQLDITNDILTKLNNEFAAGGGKAPPVAPKQDKPVEKKGAKK